MQCVPLLLSTCQIVKKVFLLFRMISFVFYLSTSFQPKFMVSGLGMNGHTIYIQVTTNCIATTLYSRQDSITELILLVNKGSIDAHWILLAYWQTIHISSIIYWNFTKKNPGFPFGFSYLILKLTWKKGEGLETD